MRLRAGQEEGVRHEVDGMEEMKEWLTRIYGRHEPLPRWAAFRHRAILMEIAKLERQLEGEGRRQVAEAARSAAEEGGGAGIRQTADGIRHTAYGIRHTA